MELFEIIALGTGPVVVAMVLGAFAVASAIVALVVWGLWALALSTSKRAPLSWASLLATLAAAACSGPLYMWAYGESSVLFWALPVIVGAFVVANAAIVSALLLRRDRMWEDGSQRLRLRLQTLLLLIAVTGVVLATLAPAFAAA